jgi:hypothetical protein
MVGCLDPYKPPALVDNVNLLIVDGFINTTSNTAYVKLSRSITLSDKKANPPEKNAVVYIECEDGSIYYLKSKEAGKYEASILNLNVNKKYRLHVHTTSNEDYRSEYIALKQSPSFDISWKPAGPGINVVVNAYDPNANTRYYQWAFTETWEYTADYWSLYKFVNGVAIPRLLPSEEIYVCWKSENSTNILIESTVRLNSDLVRDFPIQFIAQESQKISRRYSMIVQQVALDESAYNYFLQLQKTTESLGGLFDPLPSQVTGNITNATNPSQPAIGYFRGGSVQEKRIFITAFELGGLFNFYRPASLCEIDSIRNQDLKGADQTYVLLDTYGDPPIGFLATPAQCGDCRVGGNGSLTKPAFWP